MKLKNLTNSLILLILYLPPIISFAQSSTDLELHNRYWNYRERLRKHFSSIGKDPGQGFAFSEITTHAAKNTKVNSSGVDIESQEVNTSGRLNMGGDIVAYMAEYMGILSSEYWLLKNNDKTNSEEMRAVLIELYFAINAMERMDKYARPYFLTGLSDANTDGFFVRDDAPHSIIEPFAIYSYPEIKVMGGVRSQGRVLNNPLSTSTGKPISSINGENFRYTAPKNDIYGTLYKDEFTDNSFLNEMSMDQLIGVLFGFKCIMKFVDDDVVVDPDGILGPLPPKNIQNWVKELTDKMMLHLSKTTYDVPVFAPEEINAIKIKKCEDERCGGNDGCEECDEPGEFNQFEAQNYKLAAHANYVITNPHNGGKEVSRGPFAYFYGYPLEKIGEEITGKDYPEVKVTLAAGVQALRYTYLFAFTHRASFGEIGRPLEPHNASFWRDLYNEIPRISEDALRQQLRASTGSAMLIWLPPTSNTWTQSEYDELMRDFGCPEASLFWSVLNDKNPSLNANDVELILLSSDCGGLQNTANKNDLRFNTISIFSHLSTEGGFQSNNKGDVRLYNGMDWMLLYNFFRISDLQSIRANKDNLANAWKPFTLPASGKLERLPKYKNEYCPCKSSYGFYKDRDAMALANPPKPLVHTFNEHIASLPFTPALASHKALGTFNMFNTNYKNYDIHLSDWLTQNFTINNTGILKPLGDLTICNSTTTLNSGGILATDANSNTAYYKTIKIGKNAILEIKNGGILRIENNTMVIVEEDAKIIYHPGARIILNGPNAVLKFNQGQLELVTNALFKIEAGTAGRGYVHFHKDWSPEDKKSIIATGLNTRVEFDRLIIQGLNNQDKVLQITGNIGLVIDWSVGGFAVKSGFVAMGKGSHLVSNAGFTRIENCTVNTLSNAEFDYANRHGGIEIAGRGNKFKDVVIANARYAISYYNRGGQEILNLDNVAVNESDTAVYMIGGSFNIYNSRLTGKYSGIYMMGSAASSILRKSHVEIKIKGHSGSSSYMPIYYVGTGNLYVWGNVIKHGIRGLHIDGASARLKCNLFMENRTQVNWYNAPRISMGAGYNTFMIGYNYLDLPTFRHLFGRGQTYIDFKNNYSVYEIIPPSNLLVYDVRYSHLSPTLNLGTESDGGNSAYGNIASGTDMTLIPKPTAGFNYNLFTTNGINTVNNRQITLLTSPNLRSTLVNISSSDCLEANERSGSSNLSGLKDGVIAYKSIPVVLRKRGSGNSTETAWDVYNPSKVPVSRIREANVIRIYVNGDSISRDSGLKALNYTLKYNLADTLLVDTPGINYMHDLFDMAHDGYAMMAMPYDSSDIRLMPARVAPYYDSMNSMMQVLWLNSFNPNSIWAGRRFDLIMNWSQLHRLADHKTEAVAILDTGLLYTVIPEEISAYQKLRCVNRMESALQNDSTLSLDSARRMFSCYSEGLLAEDSAGMEYKDTSISFCDWDPAVLGRTGYAVYTMGAGFQDISKAGDDYFYTSPVTGSTYHLEKGVYRLTYFDTLTNTGNFTTLTVNGDTQVIQSRDTSLTICDWSRYGIQRFAYYMPNDSLPYSIINDSTGYPVFTNYFKKGSYTIHCYDTNNCVITRTKLVIPGDTQQITLDSSVINSSAYPDFIADLEGMPYHIEKLDSQNIGPLVDCFYTGHYYIERYDTNNCEVEKISLTVNGDSLGMELHDTVLYYCNMLDSTFLSGALYIPRYDMPYSVIRIAPDTSYEDYLLTAGVYIADYYDTINCRLIRVNITVEISDTASVDYLDTAVYYCVLKGCTKFDLYPDLVETVLQMAEDTLLVSDSCLSEGEYLVNYFDRNNCLRHQVNLTVIGDTGVVESLDTTISFCDLTDTAATYALLPGMYHTILRTVPDSAYVYSSDNLPEGEYMITEYDSSLCRVIRHHVTVQRNIYGNDTSYFYDTLRYSCDPIPLWLEVANTCENSVMFDKAWNALETGESFRLYLSEGYYQYICPSPGTCKINKTIISFMDSVQYPDIEYNYLVANYDRERDACCIIDVEELHCEGNILGSGDDIQIFNMNGQFLFSTVIEELPLDHLGFKFCQPYWNTNPAYISDWYSIVFRKDTCQFCRMDFYCDSAGHGDLVRPDFMAQAGQKIQNRQDRTQFEGIGGVKKTAKTRSVQSFVQYPNPTNNSITIEWLFEGDQPFIVIVTNVLGEVVYSTEISPDEDGKYLHVIPLANHANGMYSIQVNSEGYHHTSKVVLIK